VLHHLATLSPSAILVVFARLQVRRPWHSQHYGMGCGVATSLLPAEASSTICDHSSMRISSASVICCSMNCVRAIGLECSALHACPVPPGLHPHHAPVYCLQTLFSKLVGVDNGRVLPSAMALFACLYHPSTALSTALSLYIHFHSLQDIPNVPRLLQPAEALRAY
jgi:hypothetical protein